MTHRGEQGMVEGCTRYHLSPLSNDPLPAHEAFHDLPQFEAWHFKVNEEQCQSVLRLFISSKAPGRGAGRSFATVGVYAVMRFWSWLHVLWDRPWCLTPNSLLAGSKHLPAGTYSIGLHFSAEEVRSGFQFWLSFVNIGVKHHVWKHCAVNQNAEEMHHESSDDSTVITGCLPGNHFMLYCFFTQPQPRASSNRNRRQ